MNQELLKKHLVQFLSDSKKNGEVFQKRILRKDSTCRPITLRVSLATRLPACQKMMYTIIYSKLWAMLIWGNKHYVVDKIIEQKRP